MLIYGLMIAVVIGAAFLFKRRQAAKAKVAYKGLYDDPAPTQGPAPTAPTKTDGTKRGAIN